MTLWKCYTQYASKFGKLSSGHSTGKVSFHSNPKERQCEIMFKLLHIAHISHTSKIMLRILQARLQQYLNWELLDVQAGFRKGRGIRDQIANIHWVIEKVRELKTKSASLAMLKPLILWITTNCIKFLKRWEYNTTLLVSWQACMQDKKQQLELDMKQWTGSKLGKEYVKDVYHHSA